MLGKIQNIDNYIVDKIAVLHRPFLNKIMNLFTVLGNQGKIWFFISLLLIISRKYRMTGCMMILSIAITFFFGEIIIKHLVCRIRPCHNIDDDKLVIKKRPSFYSFPSGHTASSFAVFMVAFLLLKDYSLLILILAILISFSRLYLQVHYLTDILAGIVLGLLCGLLSFQIFVHFNLNYWFQYFLK